MIKSKWMGAIPKKKKKKTGWRVLRIYFSENPPGIFRFVTTKFWRKFSPLAGNSAKLCDTPWIFQHQKPRPIKIPHDLFLNTPGNSISLLIGAWGNLHIMLFIQYPWKFMPSTPLLSVLFGFFLESSNK